MMPLRPRIRHSTRACESNVSGYASGLGSFFFRAASRCAGEQPIADQSRQDLGVGHVRLVADRRHDQAFGSRQRRFQQLEVAPRNDPIFVPLKQEDLGGHLGQDRSEVELGQQLDPVRQRPDRRLAVFLEVEGPAVLENRRELGLAVIGQDGSPEGQPLDRCRGRAGRAGAPTVRPE